LDSDYVVGDSDLETPIMISNCMMMRSINISDDAD